MWLIREGLTTGWCEVTSSVRNKSSDDDTGGEKATNSKSTESSDASASKVDQEILLCLRPIRNGGKEVDESLRFLPLKKSQVPINSSSNTEEILASTHGQCPVTNTEKN